MYNYNHQLSEKPSAHQYIWPEKSTIGKMILNRSFSATIWMQHQNMKKSTKHNGRKDLYIYIYIGANVSNCVICHQTIICHGQQTVKKPMLLEVLEWHYFNRTHWDQRSKQTPVHQIYQMRRERVDHVNVKCVLASMLISMTKRNNQFLNSKEGKKTLSKKKGNL